MRKCYNADMLFKYLLRSYIWPNGNRFYGPDMESSIKHPLHGTFLGIKLPT